MKTKQSLSPRSLAEAGAIAALYVALTMAVPSISFGSVQLRLSEMLTLLPVLTFSAVPGLAVGCFLSNLLGLAIGANVAGAWDLLIGTGATLAAALLTYALRRVRTHGWPLLAAVPPVLLNALIVGAELAWMTTELALPTYLLFALSVGAGELVACIGGVVLCVMLEKHGAARRLFPRG